MSNIASLASIISKRLNSPKPKRVVNRAPTIRSTIMKVVTEGGEKEWEDGYGGCEWSDIVKAVRSVHGEQKDWISVRNLLAMMPIFRDTRDLNVERYILTEKDTEMVWSVYDSDGNRLCNPDLLPPVTGATLLRNACYIASEYAREHMRVATIVKSAMLLTEEIKDIARRNAVHCMVGAWRGFKVEGFDLGMEGGVFHRQEVGDKIVYVYWVDVPTEEQYAAGLSGFQVRVSIEYKEPRPELRNDGSEEYIIKGLGLSSDLEFEGPL